jgi:pyroglutamyl-peptidase
MIRALVTGFEPFPGAPFNPTQKLVARLLRLKRPALADVELTGHIFPVTYAAVDRELPELLAKHRPDVLLMFGLATRTPYLRIETRARNVISQLWPDADHATVASRTIDPRALAAKAFGPHTRQIFRAAASTGIFVRPSRSAGSYLCNYLSWRAIDAMTPTRGLATFIHVPLVPRDAAHARATPVSFEQMVDAGEAVLLTMVKRARQRRLNAQI